MDVSMKWLITGFFFSSFRQVQYPRLHVSSVAEIDATLGCTLVAAILQADDRLPGTQLFVGKDTLVLFRFLWPDARFAVFGHL